MSTVTEKIEANVDMEQQLLGSLLAFGQQAWSKLAGGILEADFYRDDHRRIFRHISKTACADNFDALIIFNSLERSNESELSGGLTYILQLVEGAFSYANINGHARIIKKHSVARQIQALGNELARGGDPLAVAEKLIELAGGGDGEDDAFSRQALTIASAEAVTVPPPDFIVTPLQRGSVGIISGADGSGKSFIALALAASVAHGVSVGGIFDVPLVRRRALYLAGEDGDSDHLRRMQSLARLMRSNGLRALDGVLDMRPLHGQRMPLLEKTRDGGYAKTAMAMRFARQIASYDIVIIDPLRMFHNVEEIDGVGMDILVRWLVDITIKNQQVIGVIHHASQSAILDGRSDHHVGRGATDFPAGCRAAWTMRGISQKEAEAAGLDDDQRRDWKVLVNGKASHGKEAAAVWMQRQPDGVLVRSAYSPADLVEAKRSRVGVNKLNKKELNSKNDF